MICKCASPGLAFLTPQQSLSLWSMREGARVKVTRKGSRNHARHVQWCDPGTNRQTECLMVGEGAWIKNSHVVHEAVEVKALTQEQHNMLCVGLWANEGTERSISL